MARDRVEIEGLNTVLARLKALPAEVVSKNGGPVRTGLRKGAVVIRDEMRKNAQAIVDKPNIGGDNESTGMLVKSITAVRGKRHAHLKGERFWVMIPKRRRYPFGEVKTPSGIRVETIGRMLEYGTSRRAPMMWAAPAFHAKKAEAVRVVVDEVKRSLTAIERKLKRIRG